MNARTAAGWLINDDVRALPAQAYERAMDGALSALCRHPGVVSVYQLGSVRFPGISDLDIIVVVNDDIPAGTDFRRIVHAAAGPDGPYIFSHAPYVMPEAVFPHLPSLFFADNLQWRCGRAVAIAAVPPEEAEFYAYQIAVEAAVAQSFAFLRALQNRAAPNLRSLLCHLNAVRHNFSTMSRWSGEVAAERWVDYTSRIDRLRGGWFGIDHELRAGEACELMVEARDVLLEILARLAAIGIRLGYVPANGGQACLSLLDVNVLLRFVAGSAASYAQLSNPLSRLRGIPGIGAWLRMQPRWRELTNDVSVLEVPYALSPMIDAWSDAPGPVHDILAARRFGAGRLAAGALPQTTCDWLARKGERLNAYLAFVRRARLSGLLLATPASWLHLPATLPNRLKTRWNESWVRRRLRAR